MFVCLLTPVNVTTLLLTFSLALKGAPNRGQHILAVYGDYHLVPNISFFTLQNYFYFQLASHSSDVNVTSSLCCTLTHAHALSLHTHRSQTLSSHTLSTCTLWFGACWSLCLQQAPNQRWYSWEGGPQATVSSRGTHSPGNTAGETSVKFAGRKYKRKEKEAMQHVTKEI